MAELSSDPVISMIRTKIRGKQSLTRSEQDYLKKYGKSDAFRPLDSPRHIKLGRWQGTNSIGNGFMYVSAEVWESIFGKKKP